MEAGYQKGEMCNRNECAGIIEAHTKEGGCSCHINPPCGYCTTPSEYCPVCGWDAEEEMKAAEKVRMQAFYKNRDEQHYAAERKKLADNLESFERRYRGEEVPDKFDTRTTSHTNSSMRVRGVYPPGTETRETIFSKVQGSWGGRFVTLEDYRFEFIAYTD